MNDSTTTCSGCYWNEQCSQKRRCEDFTPIEFDVDAAYYEGVLKENQEIYLNGCVKSFI